MRKSAFLILILGIVVSLSSCRKDFDTVPSSGGLEFSKSTVYLDTIFTGISSSTYMLKVYNRSNKDITIPSIRLGKGDSKYRLLVDGLTGNDDDHNGTGDGKFFPNVELLAKDSLFIFIETTANIADTEADFTYNDQILFDSGSNQQTVNLVTLIQDAIFIFPNRDMGTKIKETLTLAGSTADSGIEGHTLTTPEELNWTNTKPYVVYGYAHVPTGSTLTIAEGTKVHFHDGAGIIIDQGAHLVVNGQLSDYNSDGELITDREVTFEGDRLENSFANTPGQWGTILVLSNEADNSINHMTIKNSTVGLFLPGQHDPDLVPNLKVTNTQIYNTANIGILARNATVVGENLVINLAGQACFAGSEGGNYSMTHCTFNNNFQSSSQVAVLLDNYTTLNNVATTRPLVTSFKNSIIYGTNQVELIVDYIGTFDQSAFQNCLIKFNDSATTIANDANYAFIRTPINGNIKSENPQFSDPNGNQLFIPNTSPAAGVGNGAFQTNPNTDIFGNIRSLFPDLGAYNAFIPL